MKDKEIRKKNKQKKQKILSLVAIYLSIYLSECLCMYIGNQFRTTWSGQTSFFVTGIM